ncbi:hypothetical protein CDL12_02717 [Handroanthus impetiginosus]|uniref:Uncharacterized protein n=1 Tax=Handroanthus impetiginosus TaxID=429701 RepID=A0A2G9I448_9LAMI|nr:hypothetical protein CDL12_02717 [Handroanthus impetiginosus]
MQLVMDVSPMGGISAIVNPGCYREKMDGVDVFVFLMAAQVVKSSYILFTTFLECLVGFSLTFYSEIYGFSREDAICGAGSNGTVVSQLVAHGPLLICSQVCVSS